MTAKLTDTIVATETILDFADHHHTFYYLRSPRTDPALPFGSAAEYKEFYRRIAAESPYYSAIKGKPGAILKQLRPAYGSHKYWVKYLTSQQTDQFPNQAWKKILPIEALPTIRLGVLPGAGGPKVKLRIIPRILLYPFGWSTWISLRATGTYTISELVHLIDWLLAKPVIATGSGAPSRLQEVFQRFAAAIREDAFGGQETDDLSTSDTLTVATVLAKHGGTLALNALDDAERNLMRRIVRHAGPPPRTPFEHIVYELPSVRGAGLAYMLHEGRCRFLWVEDLLAPVDRNRILLRCYHNNTFLSLAHAWHLYVLLDQVVKEKNPSYSLRELAGYAASLLAPLAGNQYNPLMYKNASLLALFEDLDIGKTLAAVAAALD